MKTYVLCALFFSTMMIAQDRKENCCELIAQKCQKGWDATGCFLWALAEKKADPSEIIERAKILYRGIYPVQKK